MSRIHRVLVIDDNQSILDDFKSILGGTHSGTDQISSKLDELGGLIDVSSEKVLSSKTGIYKVDTAKSGSEALELVKASIEEAYPYSLVFVDFRMPPGWNGVETIKKLREAGLRAEYVICSAYSDYSWEKIISELGEGDDLLFLSKPFTIVEVKQLALSLTQKMFIRKERERVLIRLRESLKETEESSQIKTNFMSVVNHELRTPLNAIIGFSQLLQMKSEVLTEDDRGYVERIYNSGLELLGIVDKMLSYVDLKGKKIPVAPKRFTVYSLIREVVNRANDVYNRNENKIDVLMSEGVSTFVSDGLLLQQVLEQLLSNACKFTHHGTIRVEVRLDKEGDREALNIFIADSGVGVQANHLDGIFDSFYQQDSSITRRYGGIGLGLSLVKDFVHLLDGEISVESVEGRGSTFSLKIPTLDEQSYVAPSFGSPRSDGEILISDIENLKMLVVEDAEGNRELIREYYEMNGVQLFFAANGDEALVYLREKTFDVVLMDVGLPDMDGLEVVRRMKEMEVCKHTPVIAVTGFAGDDFFDMAMLAGCNDVVTKPFSFEELDRKIIKYLTRAA